ncbi:hypothetical protein LCGC14_1600770 [marine sediment metagenome]|uniref:Methylene-tetrahydrofolate reductase C-terminal-like domain-containing protein n=1 Tax=marine sediment metagenome TaxID=412755 RepID=A0A0F9IXQ5_9ZZZZ
MIKAVPKSIEEVYEMVAGKKNILVAGCGTCVTVCFAGGETEVNLLAAQLKMAAAADGNQIEVGKAVPKRQCEKEFVLELNDKVEKSDAVVSIACGVGVQVLADNFRRIDVYPGLNTTFMGPPKVQGHWYENCAGCGSCLLHWTEGICPIARCAKSLLNGPCGGCSDGKCEVSNEVDCAWYLIHQRMKEKDKLDTLKWISRPKNWTPARDGGQRTIIRKDLLLEEEGK